ncbi:adenosylcobinamide-GDP ribazoletransferase [Gordonia sp. X0973]|uniref:adenosylcobinamide-GDP ribazoletransferase n=1 Tax=Gordonia sp. X0973 TaxID=2742602 RepID=UPI00158171CB|nr:adenosylcobinamide-GDP ribazoletransferase [Gordonia sp. X0973]QKT07625.1 adenosylcobinamide-GDP ribazoletransferase [Gordonia sp. X0973]
MPPTESRAAPQPGRVGPLRSLWLAFSWLTVAPIGTPTVTMDRRAGRAAIAVTPVVGAALGAVAAAAAFGMAHTRAPDLLVGVLVVALLALTTRGMHVDGLADTADALGCYGPPERVREVMRDGGVGPFGVAALIGAAAVDAICIGTLTGENRWYAIGFAIGSSRIAAVVGCRWTRGPADSTGFGALVAGTQRWSIACWILLAAAAAYPLGVRGFVAVAIVVVGSWLFTAHCARRVGGVNGDLLGAAIELSTIAALLAFVL